MAPVLMIGKGSHRATTLVCVEGDELPEPISGSLPYSDPTFSIAGTGQIILTLPPTHKTKTLKDKGRKVLIEGPPFQAQFNVVLPAQQPSVTGTIPDPVATKALLVEYKSTTVWYKAI